MCVVKRVALSPARCATLEAVLVEVLHNSLVGQLVVALERQQVVAPALFA